MKQKRKFTFLCAEWNGEVKLICWWPALSKVSLLNAAVNGYKFLAPSATFTSLLHSSFISLILFSLQSKDKGRACWIGINEIDGKEWKRCKRGLRPITSQNQKKKAAFPLFNSINSPTLLFFLYWIQRKEELELSCLSSLYERRRKAGCPREREERREKKQTNSFHELWGGFIGCSLSFLHSIHFSIELMKERESWRQFRPVAAASEPDEFNFILQIQFHSFLFTAPAS